MTTDPFLDAEAQADPRWLAIRLADTRREVAAARTWAWQVSAERDRLAAEVSELRAQVERLESDLVVRAFPQDLTALDPYPAELVPLGWPDVFPAVPPAPALALVHADEASPSPDQAVPQLERLPLAVGADDGRTTPTSWRRRDSVALTVLPGSGVRERRSARHLRRG